MFNNYLSVTTTDIEHNRVKCTSHLTSHLNIYQHQQMSSVSK